MASLSSPPSIQGLALGCSVCVGFLWTEDPGAFQLIELLRAMGRNLDGPALEVCHLRGRDSVEGWERLQVVNTGEPERGCSCVILQTGAADAC